MDLICADISGLGYDPGELDLIGPHQGVNRLADAAGTIGYEILTSLGTGCQRRYE